MTTCIVVDDDPQAIKVLVNHIEKTPFLHLLDSFTEPIAALSFLQDSSVDLIFSDIEMPGITGIEFLRIVGSRSKVILSTGHAEYALEGYEHDVVDYLMKPVSFDRFLKAVQKAGTPSPTPTNAYHSPENKENFVLVKTETKGKMRKVSTKDIYCIEGLKNYVSIYTRTDQIIALLNIKDLEKKLPATHFMRVHKSYIVAINRITAIEGNQIRLEDSSFYQKAVPLGVTYREAFFHAFRDHILDRK